MEITSFALNNFAPEKFFGEAKFLTMNTPQKFQECRFRLHQEAFSFVERNNNQINACTPIGQSAVGYCAGKPTEKSRVF